MSVRAFVRGAVCAGFAGWVLLGSGLLVSCQRKTETAPAVQLSDAAPTPAPAETPEKQPEAVPWADAAAEPPTPERMRPALAPIYAQVQRCLKEAASVDGGGAMELHITAVPSGRIVGAELSGRPDLRMCVETAVRKLSLPAFAGQAIEMRIPLLPNGNPVLVPPDAGPPDAAPH